MVSPPTPAEASAPITPSDDSLASALRLRAAQVLDRMKASGHDGDFLVPALLALVTCVLVGKAIGLPFPVLASDEFVYAFRSKFGWQALAGTDGILPPAIPNYLYLRLFHGVHSFGGNVLDAARALNTLIFALSAFPLYRVAARFMPPGWAALTTLTACAGPTSTYAGYFMPEGLYFLVFWLTIWAFVRYFEQLSLVRLAIVTVHVAALSLVKPHGLMITVCIAFTLPLTALFQPQRASFARLTLSGGGLVIGWYVVWLALAAALTGELVFSPTGAAYSSLVKDVMTSKDLGTSVRLLALVGGRHLASICVLYTLPVALGAFGLLRAIAARKRPGALDPAVPLALVTLVVLVVLAGMSAKLTVETAGSVQYATVERLHGRYYSFALPLLVMVSGSSRRALEAAGFATRAVAALVVLAGGGIAFWVTQHMPGQYVVDFPEVFAMTSDHRLLKLALAANVVAALAVVVKKSWAWPLYMLLFLAFSFGAERQAFEGVRGRSGGSDADRMGLVLHLMLTQQQLDSLVVYSANTDVRSFFLGLEVLALTRFRSSSDLAGTHCDLVAPTTQYLVTLDPIPVECGFTKVLKVGEAQLYSRPGPSPQ
jgi:phosphoglycerol transferase